MGDVLTRKKKQYFKALLNKKLDELFAEAKRMADFKDQSADVIDQASEESDSALAFRIREREGNLIRKITDALRRLEEGAFGICEECGEQISEKRLRARPVATLCIKCKEEQERLERAVGF